MTAGSGDDALVLIHGFPLTSEMWRAQVEKLASPSRQVVAPDLPGCGRTPGAFESMDEAADAVAALLRQLRIERAVVGGFSMGGYVAFAFARRHGAMLRGLMLVDTKAGADSDDARAGRRVMAAKAREEGKGNVIETMLPRLLAETTLNGRPPLVQRVRDIAENVTLDGITGALTAMASRPSSESDLPRISVPALVMVGEHDVITPRADAEAMASAIPDAKLVVIPDAGHLTPMEQPDAVTTAMRDWLKGID
jgi:pimeloyl-ACP methyl ester carboxylesterase